jgi:hypothetical protein
MLAVSQHESRWANGGTSSQIDIRLNPEERSPLTAARSEEGALASVPIFLNSKGAFFQSTGSVDGKAVNLNLDPDKGPGSIPGGTIKAQEVILLYELGHVVNAIPDDGGNGALSQVNTQIIRYRCESLLGQ